MSKALKAVSNAAYEAKVCAERRDTMIRMAHEQGESLRAIATATGLSHQRVHQIVRP